MPKFYIVDGNSYIHRAYHALPPLNTSNGVAVNAVYGFMRMLIKTIHNAKPDYVAVCFDHPSKNFRHTAFPAYKAHRKELDLELITQMPIAREAAAALNFPVVEKEGYEADDLIATLALCASKQGVDVVIVTSDKDALQLVNEKIKVLDDMKHIIYDTQKVKERFGLPPEQLKDYFALMGDSSDNIPGVRGVGEKTALKLISTFGSIEELFQRVDELEGRVKDLVSTQKDMAYLSKELFTLKEIPDICMHWNECKMSEPNQEVLKEFLLKYEFTKFLNELYPQKNNIQLNKTTALQEEPEEALSRLTCEYNDIANLEMFKEAISSMRSKKTVFINLDILNGVALSDSNTYWHISNELFSQHDFKEVFSELLKSSDVLFVGYDLKKLFKVFIEHSLSIPTKIFDIGLGAYCINPSNSTYTLDAIAQQYLKVKLEKNETEIENKSAQNNLCVNLKAVVGLYSILQQELIANTLDKLFYNVEIPLIEVLAQMEETGLRVDREHLIKLSVIFTSEIFRIEKEVYALAGEEFNLNSPKQVSHILFDRLMLPQPKKTKTGSYQTNEEVLSELASMHEIPNKILEYREIAKLKSTYVDVLSALCTDSNCRIRANFLQTGTATGRLSCINPNLQNIPVRSKLGNEIRKAFIPEDDFIFVSSDYSQIDLRVLAHLSEDKGLLEAFRNGVDIHTATAARIFNKSELEVTQKERSAAKTINFGVVYGISPFGLSKQLDMPVLQAKIFIEEYFNRYPGVRLWQEKTIAQAKVNGFVKTLLGRKRYIPEINSKNGQIRAFAQRIAINTPVQGTSSDIIKVAMVNIYKKLKESRIGAKMLVQVHDDLLFEVPKKHSAELEVLIKQEMENAVKLCVPLVVEIKKGGNWGELQQ